MNSDPYDSAVWRSFGMLDADESAIFDEASRIDPLLRRAFLEMDRLSAAVAVTTAVPVEPKPGQLERLQARLGIQKVRRGPWIAAISGWAAAAAIAAMWLLDQGGVSNSSRKASASGTADSPVTAPPAAKPAIVPPAADPADAANPSGNVSNAPMTAAVDESIIKNKVRAETKRLVQEIEVLRDNLEKYQTRDRVLFEPVPGMALPVVMTMNPPGTAADDQAVIALNEEHSPIAALLGGSVRAMTTTDNTISGDGKLPEITTSGGDDAAIADSPPPVGHPSAIPIYDAARDAGTLVVNNLPPTADGEAYNLWVKTLNGDKPVYVGSLPKGNMTGAESFDFSLGSNMVLPSGFMLTRDPVDKPASPSEANTVLEGPPTPGR